LSLLRRQPLFSPSSPLFSQSEPFFKSDGQIPISIHHQPTNRPSVRPSSQKKTTTHKKGERESSCCRETETGEPTGPEEPIINQPTNQQSVSQVEEGEVVIDFL
jgi:hypothetical protein